MPTIKTRGWKAGCTRLCRVSMLSTERYHWEDTGPPRALEMSIFMAAPSVTWTEGVDRGGLWGCGADLGTSTLLQWSARCWASLELRISIDTVTLAAAQTK